MRIRHHISSKLTHNVCSYRIATAGRGYHIARLLCYTTHTIACDKYWLTDKPATAAITITIRTPTYNCANNYRSDRQKKKIKLSVLSRVTANIPHTFQFTHYTLHPVGKPAGAYAHILITYLDSWHGGTLPTLGTCVSVCVAWMRECVSVRHLIIMLTMRGGSYRTGSHPQAFTQLLYTSNVQLNCSHLNNQIDLSDFRTMFRITSWNNLWFLCVCVCAFGEFMMMIIGWTKRGVAPVITHVK